MPIDPIENDITTGEEIDVENFQPIKIDVVEIKENENLAEKIDPSILGRLGQSLCELVEKDIASREPWREIFVKGLERLGIESLLKEPPEFEGACVSRYPIIKDALIHFQARAMKEIFHPSGPVKTIVVGETTEELEKASKRVRDNLNYQITQVDDEWRNEDDRLTMYLPLAGSAFKKTYWDDMLQRNVSRTVISDDMIVPYNATSLDTTPRYTHRLKVLQEDMLRKQQSGEYLDVDLGVPAEESNLSGETEDEAIKDLESRTDENDAMQDDLDREWIVYEVHCQMDLESDEHNPLIPTGRQRYYTVHVEESSQKVLAIYDDQDDDGNRLRHFTHYRFFPGLGFYGYGLIHMIGDIDQAATDILRTVVNGGMFASIPGGLVSAEAYPNGFAFNLQPGVYPAVKLSPEDLAKAFFTPPFREPSSALNAMLGTLVDAGRSFASITEAMTGTAPSTGPVGTMVALIEQGAQVYSGIHARMHAAKAREYKILARLTEEHLAIEGYPYDVEGDETLPSSIVMIEDFSPRIDILPVSDPNLAGAPQRISIAQATLELAQQDPGLYDMRKVHERLHQAIQTPDYESLFAIDEDEESMPLDPVTEGALMMTGKQVKVYQQDNHEAHIMVHMQLAQSPMLQQMPPQTAQVVSAVLSDHITTHMAYAYQQQMAQATAQLSQGQAQLPVVDLEKDKTSETIEAMPPIPPDVLAQVEAQAAQMVMQTQQAQAGEPPPNEEEIKAQQAQAAWEAEEQRKQAAFEAEEKRKDEALQYDLEREKKKQDVEMRNEIKKAITGGSNA